VGFDIFGVTYFSTLWKKRDVASCFFDLVYIRDWTADKERR